MLGVSVRSVAYLRVSAPPRFVIDQESRCGGPGLWRSFEF